MAELRVLPPAAKFLKKLKDKKLKSLYKEAIDAILEDPTIGEEKSGDLKGIRGYDIYHNRINYERRQESSWRLAFFSHFRNRS